MSISIYTIPTIQPPTRTNPRVILMYGPPKVGKTTAAAALKGHFILELEAGNADFVEARKVDITSIGELLKWCEAAKSEKAKGERICGVIDTLDRLEEMCEGDATEAYKQTLIGKNFKGPSVLDLPKGAGYNLLRISFKGMLEIIEESFNEVIYLAHLRDRYVGEPGKEVASKDINLTGRCRLIACGRANAIASLYRDKDSRLIADFRTSELVSCGGHCAHLKGKQIVLGELDTATGNTIFHWDRIYLPTPISDTTMS